MQMYVLIDNNVILILLSSFQFSSKCMTYLSVAFSFECSTIIVRGIVAKLGIKNNIICEIINHHGVFFLFS